MPYLMPAEWEPHVGTWLAWPHNQEHWPGNFEPIPHVYGKIVKALASSEKVFICVNDAEMEKAAWEVLEKERLTENELQNVHFFRIPTDASWSRDHGPIFVRDTAGKLVIEDWIFNAWGKKYEPYNKDDVVPQHVAKNFEMPLIEPGIVMEGGSIDVNGKGTLLTTEQCLLNKNRNPHLSRAQIEEYLNEYFGARNILWLKEGIVGDDTDGHIDDIARFVNPTTIVCAYEEDEDDENHEILKNCYENLLRMKDQDGRGLQIVKIPMPLPVIHEGQRLSASYANFYIANTVVIVPTFRCKRDEQALKILQEYFPDRKVVGIDCVDLVWGLGTLHCSTQQMPKG